MTEKQIISRAKKRDRKAQTALYSTYQHKWYAICLRYNKNQADAMDVLQNALINIFSKIDQFDEKRGNFKAWSNQIVVNENLMFLRKRVASFKVDEIHEDYQVEDRSESALDVLSAEELNKMVQRLPDGYRIVFNLYVIEGYNHKEIGERLGISPGTSKSQLFKAKKMLQKKLEVLL